MEPRLAQLESLLLAMRDGVALIDGEFQILFLNKAARRLLKFPLNNVSSVKHLPPLVLQLIDVVLREGKEAEGELEIVQDGSTAYFQVHAQALTAPVDLNHKEKRPAMALVVMHEITRLHQLENLRREFVANVSHELKTPITSIKAAVETLQDGAVHDAEIMPKFLDIISRQSDRLNTIIEDLLSLSRLENERDEVTLIAGSVLEVLSDAIASCEVQAREKNVDISLISSGGLRVKMNRTLLEQAVVNLIDNAIKYSDAGTTVTVCAKRNEHEVEISVQDQGRGIELEHHARIFERFYRVDKARSRQAGGSGLGLSIVKHIAQVHGGRASVNSTPGEGSTFSLFVAGV